MVWAGLIPEAEKDPIGILCGHTGVRNPLWMFGLLFYTYGQHLVRDVHLSWDYGLCKDVEVLCIHRRGPIPTNTKA